MRNDSATFPEESFEYLQMVVCDHFDVGELVSAKRNDRGYINASFDIETVRDGVRNRYVLRRYRKNTPKEKIEFEHALMLELLRRRIDFTPRPLPAKSGTTYAIVSEPAKTGSGFWYFALLTHLPGEDKYSWDEPMCTPQELAAAAEVFALYHNTIFNWKGTQNWQGSVIYDRIRNTVDQWNLHLQEGGDSVFDSFLAEQFAHLKRTSELWLNSTTRAAYDCLPRLAMHGDYHPGNLKFQNGKVVGLFDFDWAQMDARCFDVGLALVYFCTSWEPSSDGDLLLDRITIFLDAYQRTAGQMDPLGPLRTTELHLLPEMITAGNLYILDWVISEFYETRPDVEEYLRYLQHGVRLMNWLESDRRWLIGAIQETSSLE